MFGLKHCSDIIGYSLLRCEVVTTSICFFLDPSHKRFTVECFVHCILYFHLSVFSSKLGLYPLVPPFWQGESVVGVAACYFGYSSS